MHLRAIAPILLATAATLPAEDAAITGPISLGMGGSRIASVDDNTAAFVNPAMLGFMSTDLAEGQESIPADNQNLAAKDFGIGVVDLTTTVRVHGKLVDYLDQLEDLDVDRLQNLGTNATAKDLDQLVKVAALLETYDVESDFVTTDTSVGLLNMRAWRIGLGVRMNGHLSAAVSDLDRGNIGIDFGAGFSDIAEAINSINPAGFDSGAVYTPGSGALSATQVDVLATAFAGNTAADFASLSAEQQQAIARLDRAMVNADLSAGDIDAIIGQASGVDAGVLTEAIETVGSATGQLDENTTAVAGVAMAYAEVPIAFGWAPADWISVGVAPKLLIGKVGAVKVRLAKEVDDISDYFADALDDAEQTITGSIDAGITVRMPMFQAALVGRNLTKPTFKAPTVTVAGSTAGDPDALRFFTPDDMTLEPQATVGLAFIPWHRFVVEADLDLNPVELAITGYEVQRANAGLRLDLWWFEPSVGISKNLAEDDIGEVIHAGVGLDLWAFRINAAGAISIDTVEIDGEEVPREASFGVGIDSEW
jgi:hypothetical protein